MFQVSSDWNRLSLPLENTRTPPLSRRDGKARLVIARRLLAKTSLIGLGKVFELTVLRLGDL